MKQLLVRSVICAVVLLTGCANQSSIWRNEGAAGNVVAMDAQQRVVLSKSRQVSTAAGTIQETEYCPEPAPDAIASFASALGVGLAKSTATENLNGNVGSAIATSVAAVGLRTPTTQVIRDLITAACIAEMNGYFKDPEFKDAFSRNQQFVLAAHAIAVIGGEPAAGQPGVGGSSGTSGLDPTAAYNNLKSAQKSRQAAESESKDAQDASDKADADLQKADDALKTAPDDAEKQKARATALATQTEKNSARDAAAARLKDAQQLEKVAQKGADATTSLTAAAAAGVVTPGTSSNPSKEKMSDKAVEQIGLITTTVLAQAFTLDKCISNLKEISGAKLPDATGAQLIAHVMDLCNETAKTQRSIQQRTQSILSK